MRGVVTVCRGGVVHDSIGIHDAHENVNIGCAQTDGESLSSEKGWHGC